ncbi:DNA mismatch repair protein MutS [Paramaledivibacter caminithermalis]|jgi:DNA mismatch repair protein MutS|uniref:DNA mismatch repair protein MutS n=1 Tax=Paramaledivibacter caminithermalis (strain DSM 15212 / CIP 107654 / DViRD3) TaxID=1121301 RepID=A0A1M6JKX4_PARC5|nr:DNA mismatch repair protein MutS [Paramaledivibacter caminithermalis]SHJ47340.1 DNA mismatch repair protein MutS [Paramaledivibacter caminithermalis DSM 15212]
MAKLTPMMRQYMDIKEKYKDYILFFRLGDFYEMFFDDAKLASRELEIALTGRDCGLGERAPMCGVPFHSADSYIARLVDRGFKVAICEQVEDASKAKGIVKREVVRIITPGTIIDPSMLNEEANNYIMTFFEDEDGIGIAYADITTGELKTTEFIDINRKNQVLDEIMKVSPREIVISDNFEYQDNEIKKLEKICNVIFTTHYNRAFKFKNAEDIIKRHFNIYSVDSFGLQDRKHSIICIGALLDYIYDTQKVPLKHIDKVNIYNHNNFMILDKFTRRNLELTETLRGKEKKGSLLWVIDKTCTSMGTRILKQWIEEPLIDINRINDRLDSVELLLKDMLLRDELRELLRDMYDLERLSSKIVYGTVNARDMIALKSSIKVIPFVKSKLEGKVKGELENIYEEIDELRDIYQLIDEAIEEDPPLSVKEGGIIKSSFNEELNELRRAITDGKKWLMDLENRERQKTGIKSLKIGFNKVFGYYIEVTKSNIKNVPKEYIRKQTLANSERYIMPELKEMEDKILGAEEKIVKLEYNLFGKVRNKVLIEINRIISTAKAIAKLDVLLGFSEVSFIYRFNKPVVNNSKEIKLSNARHPVVERVAGDETFIPNDTILDDDENRFYIITGPNMAGKSTYLRQVALNVLLAQIGCFVPADEAVIGVVDRIFTRVGASDDLFQGQSTFMVEMSELSNILNNATKNSLIILDEIGRGTSTYDGLSIAWAVVEYISNSHILGAKTLFATHYHELTELEGKLKGVKNYCISVKEVGEDIVFLRKIIRGGADQSYGIQVAKLAGIPNKVIDRAKSILKELEEKDINHKHKNKDIVSQFAMAIEKPRDEAVGEQINFFDLSSNEVIDELRKIDIINMTPIDAMNKLYKLVEMVKRI